jgi:two-component system response regulator AtoC
MKADRPFRIFVVEDDEWYSKLLVHDLSLNPDYEVKSFRNGKDCLNRLNDAPDVVTLDYRLPDMDGADVLKKIKEENPDIQVIVISGQEDIEVVVDLLKLGAYDYIVKTKDIRQRLLNTVHNIRQRTDLKSRINTLQKEVEVKYDFQRSIIGESPAIKKIFSLIEKGIQTNITVTITGETGTGKELVAKAIHYNSPRRSKPFIAVNSAAIPAELIESELFGHEKGAFTGAATQRLGKFEEADGGTLFLDEVGEMDIAFQAKLLRALQEKEITRVGSNKVIKTDCRIIVATNRNLMDEVKAGKFREDLYYRFYGLPIELPPLRERGHDLLILSKFFLDKFCKENKIEQKTLSEDAQQKIMSYAFPGNIRELKSVIDLSAVMSDEKEIKASDITLGSPNGVPDIMNGQLTLREYDLKIVSAYLKKHDNNIPLVAEKLDISQSTIYRMLKEGKMDVER